MNILKILSYNSNEKRFFRIIGIETRALGLEIRKQLNLYLHDWTEFERLNRDDFNETKYKERLQYIIDMDAAEYGEFSEIDLEQFLVKSSQIQCRVVGIINTIFKHKRYIIEVYLNRKPVVRCYKRFNQFQALYELIQMKYKNYKMGEFPSKFQIIGKQETRKSYFQNMLNQIIKDHSQQEHAGDTIHQTSRRLLSIVYLFLTSNIQEEKIRKQKKALKKMQGGQIPNNDSNLQQILEVRSEQGQSGKYNFEQKFLKQTAPQRQHRRSLHLPSESVVLGRPRSNSVQNQFVSQMKEAKTQINQFQIKFSHQASWKKRFIQVKDSGLYLYVNKLDNYFKSHIELYRIRAEFLKRDKNPIDHFAQKMQFDLTRTFKEDQLILSLYHEHDYDKILIRKPLKAGEDPQYSLQILHKLRQTIVQASQMSPIFPEFEGVFNPIGKLFIVIHKMSLNWKKHTDQQTIRIRIKTGAMVYQSRPIVYTNQIIINQGFLIPISNTFQIVRIQCYSIKDEGWVKDNRDMGKIMGVFTFNMVQFVTKPQRYLIDKLVVRLETDQSKVEKYETKMEMSIENLSDFSSIYSDSFSNQSDGVPLRPLKGIDDIGEMALTVDRILRIMGNIALLIQAFWRNVYLFKYPRMGYLFFAIILINASLLEVNQIVRQFIAFILMVVLYQQKHIQLFVQFIMNKFLFSKIHRSFKKPLILSTGQVKYLKWSHTMKYITEDYEMIEGRLVQKADKKRSVFEFIVHDRLFTISQEEQSFFEKVKEAKKIIDLVHKMINTVACSLEKVGNLLSWVDYKRTTFIAMLLLILSGLASGTLVRILVSLFCVHRFYKGMFFYDHKHYLNNRKFAVYCLRYILQKSFPTIIGEKKIHMNMNLRQLDYYLSDLVFPIHDEAAQKKLKAEMDQIMGVYLEPESLYPKAIKKNYLKLVHVLDMVETCQSRLKLKWIAGAEGISNQFQQLKQETREVPIIDIWLEETVINFIMNTPSQLFMAFHKEQLHKVEKTQNKHLKLNEKTPVEQIKQEMKQDKQNKQNHVVVKQFAKQDKQIKEKKIEKNENSQQEITIDENVEKAEIMKQKLLILKQMSQ